MWANSNFLTSDEQALSTKQPFIEEIAFDCENLRDTDDTEEILKRFHRPPALVDWGPQSAAPELNKIFGFVPPTLEQEFDEAEPFDSADGHFKKSLAGHSDCFKVTKTENGTTCVFLDGKIVSCRLPGVEYSKAELAELKSRCSCTSCKNS